jgi:DNA repair protein RadD
MSPLFGGASLLRPTQSLALFRQQVGRCLRPKPDGSPAIIADHVDNVSRHGLPDSDHEWSLDATKRTRADRK